MARRTLKEKQAPNLLDLLGKASLVPEGIGPALRDHTRQPPVRDQFQLERLEIENLWSYRKAFLQFEPGITVIAGANGSGKSSLLESIFFALYGSEARYVMGRSLDDILRIGTDSGSVRLSFLHSGQHYTAQVALRRQRASTKSERDGCQLTCDDGSSWIGIENVIDEIERLFGLDREGFVNCVYVRQGEIDRLIRADRKSREQMLDGLLGLYKLDLFVTPRSKEALRALNRQIDLIGERGASLRQGIEALEQEQLARQKLQLSEQMERVHVELKRVDEHRTDAHRLLQSYDDSLRQFAQASEEVKQIDQELSDKQQRLTQRETERKEFDDELENLSRRHQKSLLSLETNLKKENIDTQNVLVSLEQATAFGDIALVSTTLIQCRAQIETQRAKLQDAREQAARIAAEKTQRELAFARLREQDNDLMRTRTHEEEQTIKTEQELAVLQNARITQEEGVRILWHELTQEARALDVQIPEISEGLDIRIASGFKSTWKCELTALEEQYEQAKRSVFEVRSQYDALKRDLAQKRKLLETGRCPTCGQTVPHEHLAESLRDSESKIIGCEHLVQHETHELERITEKLAFWRHVQTRLDQIVMDTERLDARCQEIALQQTILTQAHERQRALETRSIQLRQQTETERQTITERHIEQEKLQARILETSQHLGKLLEDEQQLERIKNEIENLLRLREQWHQKQAGRKTLLENVNELRGDLARLQNRRAQVQERLKGQPEIESKRTQVQQLLIGLDQERVIVQERYDHLAQARGIIHGRLEQLERLQKELAHVRREQESSEGLRADLTEIVSVYQTTKIELRKRNLEALNYYFNEFFSLMDSGDSYSRVTVREDYEIEVELKNGRTLNPSLMSGGERALTNIALRCAIHQVLAKAIRRMPLILDEPTIYLDRDRVHRLQFLLENLGRRVGQVVVVSHEVGLVEGADHEYRTEKNSDNISTLDRVR